MSTEELPSARSRTPTLLGLEALVHECVCQRGIAVKCIVDGENFRTRLRGLGVSTMDGFVQVLWCVFTALRATLRAPVVDMLVFDDGRRIRKWQVAFQRHHSIASEVELYRVRAKNTPDGPRSRVDAAVNTELMKTVLELRYNTVVLCAGDGDYEFALKHLLGWRIQLIPVSTQVGFSETLKRLGNDIWYLESFA